MFFIAIVESVILIDTERKYNLLPDLKWIKKIFTFSRNSNFFEIM
jgi:hypothetical protein